MTASIQEPRTTVPQEAVRAADIQDKQGRDPAPSAYVTVSYNGFYHACFLLVFPLRA